MLQTADQFETMDTVQQLLVATAKAVIRCKYLPHAHMFSRGRVFGLSVSLFVHHFLACLCVLGHFQGLIMHLTGRSGKKKSSQ